MRLSIEHETHYRFGEPAHHTTQYLRLTPRADSCQSVLSWSVTTPGKVRRWIDGFGNFAHISVQSGVHDEVPVMVRGEIETLDTFGVVPADDGLPPLMFLRPTPYTEIDDGIDALARPLLERRNDEGAIAALHALMWLLHNGVAYEGGFTDVETTAAEALERGKGVCQDHAHLFIAGARVLGIPARYVSGYLCDYEGGRGSVATHAWAEAFVEDLGWVSFDPTNSQSATDAYVRLAIAFDYLGAAPIRGMRKGGGIEEMTVRVTVTRDQHSAPQSREPHQSQTQRQEP
ncbi:MAG: transglutaminase family protein [Rhodospirillales bacterium]|nr:transglutaminase family protein [Rhodospirillales bacterium]